MSQSDLARQLEVSPQAVSEWVRGAKQPSAERMAQIEDLLGIPMRAWTELVPEHGSTGTDDE
jgi:transcriptional regulator with XRE-family HTH domain